MIYHSHSLHPSQRSRLLCSRLLAVLVLRLTHPHVSCEPQHSPVIPFKIHRMMRFEGALRRVAAARAFAAPEGLRQALKQVQQLRATWQFAAAASKYRHAAALGHSSFNAELAWMLMWGRSGVPEDKHAAFRAAREGTRLGCAHSKGVLALCYAWGVGCSRDCTRAMQLARESAVAGSKYGNYTLGRLHFNGEGGALQADELVVTKFRMAADEQLDAAQWGMGFLYGPRP